MNTRTFLFVGMLLLLASCMNKEQKSKPSTQDASSIQQEAIDAALFKKDIEGRQTDLFRIQNENGLEAYITNYGAVIVGLMVPDKNGKMNDIVLGFGELDGYMGDTDPSFGAVVGRYANRIDGGKFSLDGKEYQVSVNEVGNNNTLHGGFKGFSEKVWEVKEKTETSISLELLSADGEEGFPGNLLVGVKYTLGDDNRLCVDYTASTDAPTVLNLSQHAYFNLNGQGKGDILGHELSLNASFYTPVNKRIIPTGKLDPVKGTPMDFTTPVAIGARIGDDFEQLIFGNGYDHNWVIDRNTDGMALAATVYAPESGRFMEVFTTEPAIQFYCGNFLDGSVTGKSGRSYGQRYGLCLETQHYPDSPNQPDFPSTVLRPGEKYTQTTCFKFSVK